MTRPDLSALIDHLAHWLPAQGPISIFIHHNPLHALEDRRFEDAVEHAADELGTEPYLAEPRYRDKLGSGRIVAKDVDALLREQLGDRAAEDVAGTGSRLDLWLALILHGYPDAAGRELSWLLEETDALSHRELWDACVRAAGRLPAAPVPNPVEFVRHADWLKAVEAVDLDAWFQPLLIRFLAGYLDQGLAHWEMPERSRGIHGCFLALYETTLATQGGDWARTLPHLVADDRVHDRDALDSIEHSLAQLGVSDDEQSEYLQAELLALRGWAGIIRQLEERPDRVPARDLIVTLRGYLAVRLLCERAALAAACEQLAFRGSLGELREWLRGRRQPSPPATVLERAWPLFHVAQLRGLDSSIVERWTSTHVAALESELREADALRRRRVLHQAFERSVRYRLYDALVSHQPQRRRTSPEFQAIFCLDEREESIRRHLEEVEPACETFGTAGFFNIAMYHQGASDAHPRPLCPVAIRPQHFVGEAELDAEGLGVRSRRLQQRASGYLGYNVQLGSRLPLRGALLMTLFGWVTLVPLILRVVFPWLFSRWRRARETSAAPARSRLQIDRTDDPPPLGQYSGFTVREMADIVRRVLDDTGMSRRLSPLVLIMGHGSISLNNPHESAHDCGACGGGRGGPNARAFAQMANDPRVRTLLKSEGLSIDDGTWFVGGQRNTCNNDVTFFDEDLLPPAATTLFARACEALEAARRREAHERCRRFENVPTWYPPMAALAHVEGRAADLAQPRPEYGHATNAFCVIGRRERTRGVFLDRRAFLVSYDPDHDPDGAILARILSAVIPVVAGISLEYYFSYVDPRGYGCGTKLPHNVTSLLGIMDGAQSDLRTGLPWQMVEVHEPTRLAVVVESPRDVLERVIGAQPAIERLVRNRWIWLAALDPASHTLWEKRADGFVEHAPDRPLPVVTGDSADWYQGKRGFLSPVAIASA